MAECIKLALVLAALQMSASWMNSSDKADSYIAHVSANASSSRVKYIDMGLGKCLHHGGDPEYRYRDGAANTCETECSDNPQCGGYSISEFNNCLLWLSTPLAGGGRSWGRAHCYVKDCVPSCADTPPGKCARGCRATQPNGDWWDCQGQHGSCNRCTCNLVSDCTREPLRGNMIDLCLPTPAPKPAPTPISTPASCALSCADTPPGKCARGCRATQPNGDWWDCQGQHGSCNRCTCNLVSDCTGEPLGGDMIDLCPPTPAPKPAPLPISTPASCALSCANTPPGKCARGCRATQPNGDWWDCQGQHASCNRCTCNLVSDCAGEPLGGDMIDLCPPTPAPKPTPTREDWWDCPGQYGKCTRCTCNLVSHCTADQLRGTTFDHCIPWLAPTPVSTPAPTPVTEFLCKRTTQVGCLGYVNDCMPFQAVCLDNKCVCDSGLCAADVIRDGVICSATTTTTTEELAYTKLGGHWYTMSKGSYQSSENWDEGATREYGPQACAADFWNLQNSGATKEEAIAFLDQMPKSFQIRYLGQQVWNSSGRIYFAERHDGMVSSQWLVHATIYNHLLDLGSWYAPRSQARRFLVDLGPAEKDWQR